MKSSKSKTQKDAKVTCKTRLGKYLHQTEYSVVTSLYYFLLVATTLHVPWLLDLHAHGISRQDKFENETSGRFYERRANNTNIHGLFMTVGVFLLPGIGLLLYRVCCCYRRKIVTRFHALLAFLSLPFIIVGLIPGDNFFGYEDAKYFRRLASFHSWAGAIAIILNIVQISVGMVLYICLKDQYLWQRAPLRARYTPYHFYIGLAAFTFAAASIICAEAQILIHSFPGEEFEEGTLLMRFVAVSRHLRLAQLLVTLVLALLYYSLLREDFRSRGRIIVAKDRNPPAYSRRQIDY